MRLKLKILLVPLSLVFGCSALQRDTTPTAVTLPSNSDARRVCLEVTLPRERLLRARAAAHAEHPENDLKDLATNPKAKKQRLGVRWDDPSKATIEYGKKWGDAHKELTVTFMGGNDIVRQKIEAVARQWESVVNIKFKFVDQSDAIIRIGFSATGSWSYVGTDNLLIPVTRATMNYGWLLPDTEDAEYQRVVLHEFGHALGMVHEHQSPNGKIQWEEEVVFRDACTLNGWDKKTVREQIFAKYPENPVTQFTEFDPTSIMMYSFPPSWTKNGFSAPVNNKLSSTDIKFMRDQYPQLLHDAEVSR